MNETIERLSKLYWNGYPRQAVYELLFLHGQIISGNTAPDIYKQHKHLKEWIVEKVEQGVAFSQQSEQ